MSVINIEQAFYSKMSVEMLGNVRLAAVSQLESNFDEFFLKHGGEEKKLHHRELFGRMIESIDGALALKE